MLCHILPVAMISMATMTVCHSPMLTSVTFSYSMRTFPGKYTPTSTPTIPNLHPVFLFLFRKSNARIYLDFSFHRSGFWKLSNPEVKPSTVLVIVVNLASAHPEPRSPLLLILIYRRLILLWLQTPRLFGLFHDFGGEGRGHGMSLHHTPGPYTPGEMLKSASNSLGMTTPPIMLLGSTTKKT